ncbi:MAG: DnaA N-terminal domain-containing protein, partial [Leptothrix sp. (in: b-proteobacteria)]
MHTDLWERGCERLAAEMPEQQFNTWIKPLPPADVLVEGEGYRVGLRLPNRFKLDWIRTQYGSRIESTLSELAGKPVRLELSILPRDATPRVAAGEAGSAAVQSGASMQIAAPSAAPEAVVAGAMDAASAGGALNAG